MFGLADLPLWSGSDRLGYLLASNRLLIIIGVLLATSAITRPGTYLKARLPAGIGTALSVLASLLLLALLTAFLL